MRPIVCLALVMLGHPAFASGDDDPERCGKIMTDQGPSLDQLRRKFLGPDASPVEISARSFVVIEGAEFWLGTEEIGPKLRLPSNPGQLFGWDSPNDHLVMQIGNYLGAMRERGESSVPALGLQGSFQENHEGASIFVIDSIDLPN